MERADDDVTFVPRTRLGRWGVALALLSVLLLPLWALVPIGVFAAIAAALIGSVLAIIAIARFGDRSILNVVAILPLVAAVAFVVVRYAL